MNHSIILCPEHSGWEMKSNVIMRYVFMTHQFARLGNMKKSIPDSPQSMQDRVVGAIEGRRPGKDFRFSRRLLLSAMCVMLTFAAVDCKPFPAPNLQNCRSPEGCCTPVLSNRTTQFKFPGERLPLRVRPAAHLVDDEYIAKYQRAVELMRALPDTDPRSFLNQYKLHCAYCDNCLFFDDDNDNQRSYPLEIHRSWLFFPWHRLYLYFHERILATLIEDDTFALPFWNWDNQSPELPQANVVPKVYSMQWSLSKHTINQTSSLYDPDRTPCAQRESGFVEFQNTSACPPLDRNSTEIRSANAHLMYVNMVGAGSTPRLFQGAAYHYGDAGGGGEGSFEAVPHGSVHGWVNKRDMEEFKDSASDPIFFGHHANVDRLWGLWRTLPGGSRGDIPDSDYRDTKFTFFDESGGIVSVSVEQALSMERLRYTYQDVPNPWLHRGAVRDSSPPPWKICNPQNSPSDLEALIRTTPPFHGPLNFTKSPLTFKLPRSPRHDSSGSEHELGKEILELVGDVNFLEFDKGPGLSMTAFAFHPNAQVDESMGCAEYLGVRRLFKHVGISEDYPPRDVWRTGIGHQMEVMGTKHLEALVVTLVGSEGNAHSIQFTSARIFYSKD